MLIGIIFRVLEYFIHMSMFLFHFIYPNNILFYSLSFYLSVCLRQKLCPLCLTLGTVLPELQKMTSIQNKRNVYIISKYIFSGLMSIAIQEVCIQNSIMGSRGGLVNVKHNHLLVQNLRKIIPTATRTEGSLTWKGRDELNEENKVINHK